MVAQVPSVPVPERLARASPAPGRPPLHRRGTCRSRAARSTSSAFQPDARDAPEVSDGTGGHPGSHARRHRAGVWHTPAMPDPAAAHALLALAVHELRSPASVIGGATRLLAADATDRLAPDLRRLVDRARRAAERLEDLLAEASELCRLEAGEAVFHRRPLSLDPIVDRVVSAFRAPDDLPLAAERRGSSQPRLVLADAARLERALAAVLEFAARSARRGGTLVVAIAPIEPAAVAICVDEAGVEGAADRAAGGPLLGPLADDRPGCGLGVALARRTIEAEGGRVAASPVGAPATIVQIVLPVQA